MKKVSIIVPVYNAEKYLNKSLDSLVNQTLEDIEIIAVDDGSTDNSLNILNEYKQRFSDKIEVFHKENGGQATARNLALNKVTGEYIICIDADDYVDLTMLEEMYNTAKEGDYDAVMCDSYEVCGKDIKYRTFKDYPDYRRLFVDAWVSPCVKIIKSSIYTQNGIRFPEGYIYEDTAWFAYVIPYIQKTKTIHKPFFYRMVNPNSTMTGKKEKRVGDIFPVMKSVLDFYKSKMMFGQYFTELEYFYARILLKSSLGRIAKISDKKLRKEYTLRTLEELTDNFPAFRRNKYLSGFKGLYIKLINKFTIKVAVWLMHLKG